jgi:hypothetical protein
MREQERGERLVGSWPFPKSNRALFNDAEMGDDDEGPVQAEMMSTYSAQAFFAFTVDM